MIQNDKKVRLDISSIVTAIKKIREIRKQYITVLFLHAIVMAIRPFIPIVLSAAILDELLNDMDTNRLIFLVVLLVSLMLITHILSAFLTKKYTDESELLTTNYYFELSKKSMKLDYEEIEKPETLDLLQFILEAGGNYMGIWHIAEYLQKGLLAVVEIVIAVVLVITTFSGSSAQISTKYAFIQSPLAFVVLAIILIAGVVVYSSIQGKLGKTAANDVKNNVKSNRFFGYLFFWISYNYANGKDIRLYNAQKLLNEKIKQYVDPDYIASKEGFVKPNIKYFSILNVVNGILLASVYLFIVLKAYIGAITVGSIFIQVNAIMRFYQSIASLVQQLNMLKVSYEHFKNSVKFFDLPEMKKSGEKPLDVRKDGHYVFEFKNVSFKYPASDDMVLENINLKIESGNHLAVVGMNGAGKTTMIKLLCRLYAPTEGTITLNGVDINEYNFDDYIDLFAVVFQDFKLFSFDLEQNIAVNQKSDKDKLEQSMKKSGLGDITKELGGDYSVSVGKNFDEEGRDFSGGEQQKIAIARALYKDAPIMILDEPTAALDPIAEFEIYSKFNEIVAKKGVIFISHRLSSCRFCHDIVVFDKGRIVQLGSHDKLVSDKDGKYYELWNAQAKHYLMNSE